VSEETVKLTIMWIGALLFGFLGGLLGEKFSAPKAADLPGATRAQGFELLDRSGNVVSVWRTDQWGRPLLAFGDKAWEGRIVIGPLFPSDIANERNPTDTWGVTVEAPSHAARATLGTSTPITTKTPTGFVSLQSGRTHWLRDVASEH
jgi:hypothetical protein